MEPVLCRLLEVEQKKNGNGLQRVTGCFCGLRFERKEGKDRDVGLSCVLVSSCFASSTSTTRLHCVRLKV